MIYVISDGKENGSKATYKEVLRYLQTNDIAVYGTLVGDSAQWGEGYLSRFHLPFHHVRQPRSSATCSRPAARSTPRRL